MAKARSPQYPAIGLKEAIEKVDAIYKKDYQNLISREVAGVHMGYKSLHGNALGVLSALVKYGLLEGRGDETKVSDAAVTIIAHDPGSPERVAALITAGGKPKLFAELDTRFPSGKASDQNLRSFLLTQKYIPAAADTAIRAYRETKQLVEAESGGYSGEEPKPETPAVTPQVRAPGTKHPPIPASPTLLGGGVKGTRQEVITLDEGDVVITFPENLSAQSFGDLKDHLGLFIKKMQRRAYVPPHIVTGEKPPKTILGEDDEAAN
jgi:hypothetical protein